LFVGCADPHACLNRVLHCLLQSLEIELEFEG
jgi:hypothetical protein